MWLLVISSIIGLLIVGNILRVRQNLKVINRYFQENFPNESSINKHKIAHIAVSLDSAIIQHVINDNYPALTKDYHRGVAIDSYGIEDDSKWLKVVNKINDNITLDLMEMCRFELIELCNFTKQESEDILHSIDDSSAITAYFNELFLIEYQYRNAANNDDESELFNINDLELITDGIEYEHGLADLINNADNDWVAEVSQASNDQGLDIKATHTELDIDVAIQAKLYSSPVGNKAVQEVIAAKGYYDTEEALVVTNSTYTKSAIDLANRNNIHIIHHKSLLSTLNELSAIER